MASYTQNPIEQTAVPYMGIGRRQGVSESFAALRSGAGNSATHTAAPWVEVKCSATVLEFQRLVRTVLAFDIGTASLPYSFPVVTAASLDFDVVNIIEGSPPITGSDTDLGLVAMDETDKAGVSLDDDDYDAVYGGFSNGEIASRVTRATYGGAGSFSFTLNSTGIDYLNQNRDRTNKPGTVYMGICFAADIDNTTPGWNAFQGSVVVNVSTFQLNITYGSNQQINIGDSWKDITIAYINVGDTWKAIESAKVNVSDVWKDIY